MSISLTTACRCLVLLGLTSGSAIGFTEDKAPTTPPPLRIIQGFNDAGEVVIERIGLVVESTEAEERILTCEQFTLPLGASVFKVGDEEARWEKWENGLQLMEADQEIPKDNFSVWRCKPKSNEETHAGGFNSRLSEVGQTLFGPTVDDSHKLVWQKCIVTGFIVPGSGSTWELEPIQTTIGKDSPPPPMLFDAQGRLTAVLLLTNSSSFWPRPQGMFDAPNEPGAFGGQAVLAYFSVVDLFYRFESMHIPLSEEFRSESHRREVQRLNKQRPVASESFFLTWSDNHDELQGFSRKTGKTTKLKIQPQDLFLWATSADAVVVKLGDTVAGYSSITESWDELTLPVPPAHVVSAGGKLYLQGPPHHYEFSATVGKWISPTDTEIDAKRALHTDAQSFESTPQIALAHPSQPNVERERAVSAYNAAEQAALLASRDYRTEATQQSPDPKALAELKQKLDAAVKAAFEAQINLQHVRLQIAQQDLAEVQAKHQRRQTLAEKIIARRIEDLINGEDLEWKETKHAAEPKAPDSTSNNAPSIDGSWYGLLHMKPGEKQPEPVFVTFSGNSFVVEDEKLSGTFDFSDPRKAKMTIAIPNIPPQRLQGSYQLTGDILRIEADNFVTKLSLTLRRAPSAATAEKNLPTKPELPQSAED